MTESESSDARNALLDQSDWYTQTTAVLPTADPTADPVAVTCLTFSLTPAERGAFDEITRNQDSPTFRYAASWLVQEATGLESVDDRSAKFFRGDETASEPGSMVDVVANYVASLEIDYSADSLVRVIQDLRIPIFGSQPTLKTISTIASGALMAGGFIQAVGQLSGVGTTLALITPTTGALIIVGATVVLAGISIIKAVNWIRQKRARIDGPPPAAEPVPVLPREPPYTPELKRDLPVTGPLNFRDSKPEPRAEPERLETLRKLAKGVKDPPWKTGESPGAPS